MWERCGGCQDGSAPQFIMNCLCCNGVFFQAKKSQLYCCVRCRERMRSLRQAVRKQKQSRCERCGKSSRRHTRTRITSRRYCLACSKIERNKSRRRTRNSLQAKRRAAWLCVECGEPTAGQLRCELHRAKRAGLQKAWYKRKRNGQVILRYPLGIFEAHKEWTMLIKLDDPTPEEIAARAAGVRETWSEEQRRCAAVTSPGGPKEVAVLVSGRRGQKTYLRKSR